MTLSPTISKVTTKHCAALMYGTVSDLIWKGSDGFIESQGTLTFVKLKGRLFGLTNQHVVHQATTAYAEKSGWYVFIAALKRHTHVPGMPIAQFTQTHPDFPFDLAVFSLPIDFLEGSEKRPIDLDLPPPANLKEGAIGLAVGFPGHCREKIGADTLAHRLFHVVGTCLSSSDRKIVLFNKFERECEPHRFGGMSGGPIFSLGDDDSCCFQGILFEGRGSGDVATDEPTGQDFWIYGFPVSGSMITQALDSVGFAF